MRAYALLAIALIFPASAAMADCVDIENEAERLACYEAQNQHLNHEPQTAWNSLSHNGL